MKDQEKQLLFQQAKQWIVEAGERIRTTMHKPFAIDTKSNPDDLVTEVDQETERFFAEKIRDTFPSHRLLGEEGFGDELQDLNGIVWIVDPIDGTMNFVHQKQNFAISVGIYQDGIGEIGFIYDVMADILYQAKRGEGAYKNNEKLDDLAKDISIERSIVGLNAFWTTENPRVNKQGIQSLVRKVRGTRSYGSAALEFAYVAEGNMDAYVTMRLAPWDIAAGIVILNEVGGITTRADGSEVNMLTTNSIIASNPMIHQEIIKNHIELK